MKKQIILLTILFIATVVRFCGLSTAPVSLNWDEASLGYNAYSILKTGKDEWGNFLPTIFPAFGDYKLPVYVYGSTLPIALFGLNQFSVRFLSALAGVFAVFGVYLLTNSIFALAKLNFSSQYKPGLVSAFILALLPWHMFLSRPALEANLALTLFIFGIYFLINSLHNQKYLPWSALLLGLSMHTYNTYRILVPLVAILFLVFYYKKIVFYSRYFLAAVILAVVSTSIIFLQLQNGQAIARYEKLKILNPNIVYQIGQNRAESNLPAVVSRLVHNRPVYFVTQFTKNYLSYFTPQFWNQSKGAQYQFAIPGQNLATYAVTTLFILGFIFIVFLSKERLLVFLVGITLLSPIAAALTMDPPQAIRPSPFIFALPVIATIGFYYLLKSLPKYALALSLVLGALFMASSLSYLQNYWNQYQVIYSSSWQYGYSAIFNSLATKGGEFDKVFITKKYGEPHIFYMFYNKIDPSILHNQSSVIRFKQTDWLWTDKIQNYYFVNDWQIPTSAASTLKLESGEVVSTKNSILVTTPDHVPENATIIDSISFLDGKIAFIILKLP